MNTSMQLIELAKQALNVESDYALCRETGISLPYLTDQRRRGKLSPETAFALARAAGVDAARVAVWLAAERVKNTETVKQLEAAERRLAS